MDLSPAQRKLVFAVIVAALAGLCAFLLWPAGPSARGAAAVPHTSTAPVKALTPAAADPVVPGSAVNIYQWLPFTQADLGSAAGVVRQFCTAYATYSYTESAAGYVATMRGLVTPMLSATLARGFATPGVARARIAQRETASGNGVITALRAFGPSTLTFLVTVVQKTYQGQPGQATPSVTSTSYAVTVAHSSAGWQVNDIQLATAGNV